MLFETIRQVAKRGILSEFRLRQMKRDGKLPGIYSGSRFYVNVDMLVSMVNDACEINAGMVEK